ncbi:hypothetical protein BJV82DRAFT_549862 [Fennellomyces sp. T-0311]|nr:hypothetical protein BJV82DRAFT_549862 [Fennellomyces sp. T-0311]
MVERKPMSKPVANVTRNKETELAQLERRYRSTFKKVSENEDCTIVRVSFPPSDPDFPFELDSLQLQIRIPARYPKEPCSVIVMNTDIPRGFAFNLEKGFDTYTAQTTATLVRQMGWLDKNMETLLQQEPATTMRFVSSVPKPKPDEPEDSLIAPALPDEFVAAAAATAAAVTASSSRSTQNDTKESKAVEKVAPSGRQPSRQLDAEATPFFTSAQLSEASQKRERELNQLQARFRTSHKILRNDHVETVVQLVLDLNDPDFSYRDLFNKELKVKYHVPVQYPLLPCTIEVENKALGSDEARDISYAFAEHAEKSDGTLFQNLNWLNRNLETILRHPPERPWEVEEQDSANEADVSDNDAPRLAHQIKPGRPLVYDDEERSRVIVVDDPSFLRPADFEPSSSTAPPAEDLVEQPIPGSSSANDEPEQASSSTQPQPTVRKGTEIFLHNYRLDNVTLFRCHVLNMVVKCSRCKTMVNIDGLVPKDPFRAVNTKNYTKNERWESCSKCQNMLGVKFFSELMHQNSNKLGLLQVSGCTPFDIMPSTYIGACAACMEEPPNGFHLAPHEYPVTKNCFGCHTPLTMGLGDFRFIQVGQDNGERFEANEAQVAKAVMKRKKKRKEQALVVGESLPQQGTCEHYHKSKRWFRFPCCSKLYPCDVCHDSNEDHVYELARRHVCGICSREQAIKPTCVCGYEFERSHGNRRFWEGGLGTRSVTLMSRKDPHKHRGQHKTTSKKQERVGVAGKNKYNKPEGQ